MANDRWQVFVSYKDATPTDIIYIEELGALQDIIEKGPHWGSIDKITIFYTREEDKESW